MRLTSAAGWKSFPGPDRGGPSSIFQDEGASTDVTGTDVVVSVSMVEEKGSLTSPAKLNPNQVSVGCTLSLSSQDFPTKNGINDMTCVVES